MTKQLFERSFALEDISVLRAEDGGDGRTVTAYAAVYNRVVEVDDWEGVYEEVILPGAFSKTITEKGSRFQVLFNHGRNLAGQPAERYAMPIGTPIEVTEDRRGVRTVTRYAKTPLADEVLALIDNDSIRGQSFSGQWMNSREILPARAGKLRRVERLEIAMREYGPTPFPVYHDAAIVGVRAEDALAEINKLSPDERTELSRLLATGTPLEAVTPTGDTGEAEPPDADTQRQAAEGAPVDRGPSLDLLQRRQDQRRRRT